MLSRSNPFMTVTVAKYDKVALLGRDWLEMRGFDWQSIVNSIDGLNLPPRLQPWNDLFRSDLENVSSLKVKLMLKLVPHPSSFANDHAVPYALHDRVKN